MGHVKLPKCYSMMSYDVPRYSKILYITIGNLLLLPSAEMQFVTMNASISRACLVHARTKLSLVPLIRFMGRHNLNAWATSLRGDYHSSFSSSPHNQLHPPVLDIQPQPY